MSCAKKRDNFGETIKDIENNPDNWEKIGEKLDLKQPKDGKSIRESWKNKNTGDVIEKHILERKGKPAKNHPHYKPTSQNSN